MVGQQGLLPTARDPKLWLVECVTGSEREAVLSLMKKARAMAAKGTPLEIKSVFCQDHLKGFLYIEAFKETHVREATRGLRIIRNSKDPHMVPLREMAESITVNLAAKAPIGSCVIEMAEWWTHGLLMMLALRGSSRSNLLLLLLLLWS